MKGILFFFLELHIDIAYIHSKNVLKEVERENIEGGK